MLSLPSPDPAKPPLTLSDESQDRLTRLAARSLDAPVAFLSWGDSFRYFYNRSVKSSEPLEVIQEDSLTQTLFQHIATLREPFIVEDARTDPRFSVESSVRIHEDNAYLGVPLALNNDTAIGCLCVMDAKARQWSQDEVETLSELAILFVNKIRLSIELSHLETLTRDFVAIGAAAAVASFLLWQANISEVGEGALEWKLRILNEESAQRFLPLDVPEGFTYSQAWYPSVHPEDMARIDLFGDQSIRAGRSYSQEFRCRRQDGEIRWLREVVEVEVISTGHWKSVGVCTDITEHKKTEEALSQLAVRDELTGLYNRRELYRLLKEESERYVRYGHEFSLILLDVDQFKSFNDAYGHHVGDAVLGWIGQRMSEVVRSIDRSFRHGGDELAILLPATSEAGAVEVAERLRRQIDLSPFLYEKESKERLEIPITVSIGVATSSRDLASEDQLLLAADQALYRAKRNGRNCVAGVPDSGF